MLSDRGGERKISGRSEFTPNTTRLKYRAVPGKFQIVCKKVMYVSRSGNRKNLFKDKVHCGGKLENSRHDTRASYQ